MMVSKHCRLFHEGKDFILYGFVWLVQYKVLSFQCVDSVITYFPLAFYSVPCCLRAISDRWRKTIVNKRFVTLTVLRIHPSQFVVCLGKWKQDLSHVQLLAKDRKPGAGPGNNSSHSEPLTSCAGF